MQRIGTVVRPEYFLRARVQLNRRNRFSVTLRGRGHGGCSKNLSNGRLFFGPDSRPKKPEKMSVPVCVARSALLEVLRGIPVLFVRLICSGRQPDNVYKTNRRASCTSVARRLVLRWGESGWKNASSVRSYRIAVKSA